MDCYWVGAVPKFWVSMLMTYFWLELETADGGNSWSLLPVWWELLVHLCGLEGQLFDS